MYAQKLRLRVGVTIVLATLFLISGCGEVERTSDGPISRIDSIPVLPGTDDPDSSDTVSPPPNDSPPHTDPPLVIETPPVIDAPALAAPSLEIDDVSVTEGDDGTVDVVLTLWLSEPALEPVVVDWSTTAASATSDSDFIADQGMLTLPPGTMINTVTVQIVGDSVDEPNENFEVRLSNVVNAIPVKDTAVITIADNDFAPTLSVFGTRVTERQSGVTQAEFAVALSYPSGQDVLVDYYTVDGTATRDADFEFSLGTLTIPAGATMGTISVPVFADTVQEPEESFELVLETAVNATITTSSAIGFIDDDYSPTTVTLQWEAPLTSPGASCAEDVAGYRIFAGNSSGEYTRTDDLALTAASLTCKETNFDATCSVQRQSCSYTIQGLAPGTWFFTVQAYDQSMNYSPYSEEVSGDIL